MRLANLLTSGIAADGTAIANTTTETDLITAVTLPLAEVIQNGSQGKTIRALFAGLFSTTGTPNLRLQLYINGVSCLDTPVTLAMPSSVTNQLWIFDGVITPRNINGGGTVRGFGEFTWYSTQTSGSKLAMWRTGDSAVGFGSDPSIALKAKWGTADPANTIKVTHAIVTLE